MLLSKSIYIIYDLDLMTWLEINLLAALLSQNPAVVAICCTQVADTARGCLYTHAQIN